MQVPSRICSCASTVTCERTSIIECWTLGREGRGQAPTHRRLLAEFDHEYVGADIRRGRNVDVVMKKPFHFPFKANSFDVVMSNQAFEHISFPWATFLRCAAS